MQEEVFRKRNSVEFKVWGKYALFSDPSTRVGGEKCSYQVPTYQALKGILESVYWKPTFIWIIDAVRIVKKIQTEGKGMRPIKLYKAKANELAYYTYLKDVEYQVLAHFIWNENRPNLKSDRNEYKHHNIAKRMIDKGGRRDIFLGTRECQGYVEPCIFGEGSSFYDNYGELNLGFMLHGIDYPDEIGENKLGVRFWHYKMNNGVILFPSPKSSQLKKRIVRENVEAKVFEPNINFLSVEDEKGGCK